MKQIGAAHVRQTLRMSAMLLIVMIFGTAWNWPSGGLEAIRASALTGTPAFAGCGGPATSGAQGVLVCPGDDVVSYR